MQAIISTVKLESESGSSYLTGLDVPNAVGVWTNIHGGRTYLLMGLSTAALLQLDSHLDEEEQMSRLNKARKILGAKYIVDLATFQQVVEIQEMRKEATS